MSKRVATADLHAGNKSGKKSGKKRIIIGVIALIVVVAGVVAAIVLNQDKPYNYDLSKYLKVGKYKGLEIEKKEKVTVSKKEVNEKIDQDLEAAKTTKDKKSGKVKSGDTVKVDFVGKIDGKTFDGGSGKDASVEAGPTKNYIEGFESGIVGMKVGEKKTLKLKFPSDYQNAEVAGKDVSFKVTVKAITKNIIPELNDEFVKKNTDYNTVSEYKEGVKKDLKKQKEETIEDSRKSELWNQVVSSSEVKKYPEKELANAKADVKKQFESYASQSGSDIKTIREQMGLSKDKDYNSYVTEQAKSTVKNEMVVYYIADKENIKLDKDPAKELKKIIDESGFTDETFKSQYGQTIKEYIKENKDTYEVSLLTEKVTDFIYKNAKVKGSDKKDKKDNKDKKDKKDNK